MDKTRAGIKNKIIAALAVACAAYFVAFWMGTEKEATLEAYEKAAEEAMIADTEILAHNGHIRAMDGQDTEIRDLYNDKPVLLDALERRQQRGYACAGKHISKVRR